MDSGDGTIVDDNQSIYGAALKALVDEFVAAHADTVDLGRIYVGGLSNGGFMGAEGEGAAARVYNKWAILFTVIAMTFMIISGYAAQMNTI